MSTPAGLVINRPNRHRLEAFDAVGTPVGTAVLSRGSDCEWAGWLVVVGDQHEVVLTVAGAREALARLAGAVA